MGLRFAGVCDLLPHRTTAIICFTHLAAYTLAYTYRLLFIYLGMITYYQIRPVYYTACHVVMADYTDSKIDQSLFFRGGM